VNPNTHVILNTLSKDYLKTAGEVADHRDANPRKGITMAYLSGSHSHDADFATIEDALVHTLRKHPKTRLLLVGPLDVSGKLAEFEGRIIRQGFKPLCNRLGAEAKHLVEARYTPEQCKQAWEKLIPSVIETQTIRKIGRGQYLMSFSAMTLQNWRYELRQWLLRRRKTWLGR